jgi:hypothetical protein
MEEGTKPIDRVCFRLNYAGLSGLLKIESEEHRTSPSPTSKRHEGISITEDYQKK